jgi:hypothetical protein
MSRPNRSKPASPVPGPATPAPETLAAAATAPAPDPVKNIPQVAPDPTGAVSAPASAAAEAAAAPVDPHMPTGPGASPLPANAPDGSPPSPNAPGTDVSTVAAQGFVLRVKGPAKGRWRAGRHFGPEAVDIPVDELSVEELQKLHGDPELTCLVVGED